ncbi:MAG: alpha-hydroxy-acid oxidizing protein [Propionibacteriales bacterium]|nr:alpha-hydroxy-acid oxidizing protein [Propionibacteriales bacterium]
MTGPGLTWLASLEEQARRTLPPEVFRYYMQGARDSVAAAEARGAWTRFKVAPRIFADVRDPDLATDFLGWTATSPFGIAPTTLQRAADPGGEVTMAAAARSSGVPVVVSSNATASFADIGATGANWWLQAYLPADRSLAVPMLAAAVEAGARAVVLTVDTPVVATKYDQGAVWRSTPAAWVRANLGTAADAPKAQNLGPADIGWLRDLTGLPVVVKGVLRPEAAAAAVIAGAAAVWVSNHGGRQLDAAVATADVLGAVVERIGGAVPVYVDGGVRSGIDALIALALGASGIFLGRPPLFALACASEEGVRRLFSDLAEELAEALVLSGCATPRESRGLLAPRTGTTAL